MVPGGFHPYVVQVSRCAEKACATPSPERVPVSRWRLALDMAAGPDVLRDCIEGKSGAPERIRTSDPQIRSLVLYPAELRAPVPHRGEAAEIAEAAVGRNPSAA